jgi:hypothetical protein
LRRGSSYRTGTLILKAPPSATIQSGLWVHHFRWGYRPASDRDLV